MISFQSVLKATLENISAVKSVPPDLSRGCQQDMISNIYISLRHVLHNSCGDPHHITVAPEREGPVRVQQRCTVSTRRRQCFTRPDHCMPWCGRQGCEFAGIPSQLRVQGLPPGHLQIVPLVQTLVGHEAEHRAVSVQVCRLN